MGYKFNIGDLVFMNNPESSTTAGILHIIDREFKRYDDDKIPHKYYHGYAIGLALDDNGLYVPLSCLRDSHAGAAYEAVWSPKHRESELEIINSRKINIFKLFPYICLIKSEQ